MRGRLPISVQRLALALSTALLCFCNGLFVAAFTSTSSSARACSLPHLLKNNIKPPSKSVAARGTSLNFAEVDSNPAIFMDDILRGNSTVAATAVSILMEVRGSETMEHYLNSMVPPKAEDFPFWVKLPLLSRLSRRARKYRLRKLLDLSTPTVDGSSSSNETTEAAENKDDEESKSRRERRALFILLRNMSDKQNDFKGISNMLIMAKRDAKNSNLSSEELIKRTPSDLETPKYEVLSTKSGGIEIRRYEQFSVCSVTMNELKSSGTDKESASNLSNPQLSGASSFGALAGYLFGKNQEATAMKMTTPVFSEGEGNTRKMSFVLPSNYWNEEDVNKAPKPLTDSAVKVSSVEGCDRAVLAFGGFGRKNDVDARSEKLREYLNGDKEWKAVDGAPVVLAQYNDPFTPPWKRRNEVSVLVEQR